MRVLYIFRNPAAGYSIAKVFREIVEAVPGAERIDMPACGGSPLVVWKNLLYTWRHRKGHDAYHITGDVSYCALALPGRRTVLTVHDMNLLEYYKAGRLKQWMLKLFWYYLPMKRVAAVTCISEKTRQELIKYYPWVAPKALVVGNPYDSAMNYCPKAFPEDKPWILHIGTRPNKNLDRVVEALKDVPCHLRVIGPLSGPQREMIESGGMDFSVAEGLSDAEIAGEYRRADIVSFPSLYEGFGMPIIEGFAIGRVVVTSKLEPMVSVAGGAAILVDPESVDSIREGFLSAIRHPEAREDLITKGLEVARNYSVPVIAGQYMEVYNRLLGQ